MTDSERETSGDFLADASVHDDVGHRARLPGHDPFRAMFDEHRAPVRRMLHRLGARLADIDDLTQEVFFVLHRRRDGYDPARPLRPWLYGIAARVVVAQRRRARRTGELSDDAMVAVEDAAPLPDRTVELRQDFALMVHALGAIDQERRALLLMHDLDGVSVPEIASAQGVSANTVYSRLRLARADFQAAWSGSRGGEYGLVDSRDGSREGRQSSSRRVERRAAPHKEMTT
jgi:RNA polymerase sigma-70 factor (ECF subfamily)